MASLDDLVQPLRSVAPEGAVSQLRQAYVEAARRFFAGSWGWREFVSVAAESASVTDHYVLTPPAKDTEVFRIDAVWHSGKRLAHFGSKTMNSGTTTGTPTSYRDGPPNTVIVSPDPGADESANITVLGVIRPIYDSTTIGDEVVSNFGEDLLNGARWHLFAMVGEWQDLETAEYYRKLFQARVDEVRRYAIQGEYFQYLV